MPAPPPGLIENPFALVVVEDEPVAPLSPPYDESCVAPPLPPLPAEPPPSPYTPPLALSRYTIDPVLRYIRLLPPYSPLSTAPGGSLGAAPPAPYLPACMYRVSPGVTAIEFFQERPPPPPPPPTLDPPLPAPPPPPPPMVTALIVVTPDGTVPYYFCKASIRSTKEV